MKNLKIKINNKKNSIINIEGLNNEKHYAEIIFYFRDIFEKQWFQWFWEYQDADESYFTHDICEYITDIKKENDTIFTIITIEDKTIIIEEYFNEK